MSQQTTGVNQQGTQLTYSLSLVQAAHLSWMTKPSNMLRNAQEANRNHSLGPQAPAVVLTGAWTQWHKALSGRGKTELLPKTSWHNFPHCTYQGLILDRLAVWKRSRAGSRRTRRRPSCSGCALITVLYPHIWWKCPFGPYKTSVWNLCEIEFSSSLLNSMLAILSAKKYSLGF